MHLRMRLKFNHVRRHLVWLCGLVENTGVDGRRHQVIGRRDGVNIPSQVEVELERRTKAVELI